MGEKYFQAQKKKSTFLVTEEASFPPKIVLGGTVTTGPKPYSPNWEILFQTKLTCRDKTHQKEDNTFSFVSRINKPLKVFLLSFSFYLSMYPIFHKTSLELPLSPPTC